MERASREEGVDSIVVKMEMRRESRVASCVVRSGGVCVEDVGCGIEGVSSGGVTCRRLSVQCAECRISRHAFEEEKVVSTHVFALLLKFSPSRGMKSTLSSLTSPSSRSSDFLLFLPISSAELSNVKTRLCEFDMQHGHPIVILSPSSPNAK